MSAAEPREPIAADAAPEIVSDFITESREHLDAMDERLLLLEKNPSDMETVNNCFRSIHTIKGVSGFIGAKPITTLAHAAEDLMNRGRDRTLTLSPAIIETLIEAVELLRKMVGSLSDPPTNGRITCLKEGADELTARIRGYLSGIPPVAAPATAPHPEPEVLPPEKDPEPLPAAAAAAGPAGAGLEVKETLRIEVDKIDHLVNAIGELIIAESIVFHDEQLKKRITANTALQRNVDQMKQISRTLQDMAVLIRLVPLQATFQKMQRLTRDVARKVNKKVEVLIAGGDAEIDRSLVEKLVDPLMHLLRNSVDHGIESESQRAAAGKAAAGRITLSAHNRGEKIVIEVTDDGKGLNRERIVAKALEKKIITSAEGMSENEIFRLIFLPGFSTAEKLSEISGRGVGMDVVRTNVEAMGGHVEIRSVLGKGTTISIILPLTMGIIDGMLVRVGAEKYILPIQSIIENCSMDRRSVTQMAGESRTIKIRNEIIPLIHFSEFFGLDCADDGKLTAVVVMESDGRKLAAVVDEILGQQQIVIKNISDYFGKLGGISGATIMSDGTVGLIADPAAIIRLSRTESKLEAQHA